MVKISYAYKQKTNILESETEREKKSPISRILLFDLI